MNLIKAPASPAFGSAALGLRDRVRRRGAHLLVQDVIVRRETVSGPSIGVAAVETKGVAVMPIDILILALERPTASRVQGCLIGYIPTSPSPDPGTLWS
jgi:hypothetical protein